MDQVLEHVRRLVEKASASRDVKPETRLLHDLHLDGDDVLELLEGLVRTYGTSFSSMSFTDFFHEEPEALGAHIAFSLRFRSGRKPVTVQHLAEVVKRGTWFEPPSG